MRLLRIVASPLPSPVGKGVHKDINNVEHSQAEVILKKDGGAHVSLSQHWHDGYYENMHYALTQKSEEKVIVHAEHYAKQGRFDAKQYPEFRKIYNQVISAYQQKMVIAQE